MKARKTKRARALAVRRGKLWHCVVCGGRTKPNTHTCRACFNFRQPITEEE